MSRKDIWTGPDLNDAERAMNILAHDSRCTVNGPTIEIRRRLAPAGTVSDGTRVIVVNLCERHRYLTAYLGWNILAEIDQRPYFGRPGAMVEALFEALPTAETYQSELTPEGEQTVIPGCERNRSPRATQLDLFG